MALKDLLHPALDSANERPSHISCPKYERSEGNRCRYYVSNGACARPDEFMCVEWLKLNGTSDPKRAEPEAPPPPAPRDLFGNPVVPAPERPKVTKPVATTPAPAFAQRELAPEPQPAAGLTAEDIESFKALEQEVLIDSDTYGKIWIVPEYTGQPRRELTPEHVATLSRVLSVFPGARVVSFEKAKPKQNPRPSTAS